MRNGCQRTSGYGARIDGLCDPLEIKIVRTCLQDKNIHSIKI